MWRHYISRNLFRSFNWLPSQVRCMQAKSDSYDAAKIASRPKPAKKMYTNLEVITEKSVYDAAIDRAKWSIHNYFSFNGNFSPPPPGARRPSNSIPIEAHYSFDMAQQLVYPNDPLQAGCMDSLVPRKCAIFGVCCEAIPYQINYLTDEAVDVGKGPNAIVSMLHHFFMHYGLGEKTVHLHADNCPGQNKNSIMIHYLLWRVMTGLHDHITLSFMIPGYRYAKFAPDKNFRDLRNLYKQTKVGGLTDLNNVINRSSDINIAQPTGSTDGQVIIPSYNWKEFFMSHFEKVDKIQELHHLRFESFSPGCVFIRKRAGEPEMKLCILKREASSWKPASDKLPPNLPPTGLSLQRQWYLYERIRKFCPDHLKDITCPKPSREAEGRTIPSRSPLPSPSKQARLCRLCRQPGHNARTCPTRSNS